LPQRAAAEDRAGGDALSHPAEIVDLAEVIHARYRALVFVGAYGGRRIGKLAGLRQSRIDLLAGAVIVAEILTEVKGKLIAGPPKTHAGRRTVGLLPFVVRELEAHLACNRAASRRGRQLVPGVGPRPERTTRGCLKSWSWPCRRWRRGWWWERLAACPGPLHPSG
jgi:integrase